jgi:hypothetical protein
MYLVQHQGVGNCIFRQSREAVHLFFDISEATVIPFSDVNGGIKQAECPPEVCQANHTGC